MNITNISNNPLPSDNALAPSTGTHEAHPSLTESEDDLTEFKNCMGRQDFSSIIRDSHLFWVAAEQSMPTDLGYTQLSCHSIKFIKGPSVKDDLQRVVEFVRRIAQQSLSERQNFSIATIEDLECGISLFLEEAPRLDLSSSEKVVKAARLLYNPLIRIIPLLMTQFHTTVTTRNETRETLFHCLDSSINFAGPLSVKIIDVIWNHPMPDMYPVSKMEIPLALQCSEDEYALYEARIGCDWEMVSDDQVSTPIHSLVLARNRAFLPLFTSEMRENIDRKMELKCSQTTLLHLIKYLYLGGEKIFDDLLHDPSGAFELFEIAHQYQEAMLMAYCINAIILSARQLADQDESFLPGLLEFSIKYENSKLRELYCKLSGIADHSSTGKNR